MSNFFHIGVVVDDLTPAIEYYQNKHNLRFADIATQKLNITNPQTGVSEVVELNVSYSRSGPPYLELIQAVGEGIFSVGNAGQILYYGKWENDLDKLINDLNQENEGIEAIISPDDLPEAIITAPDQYGVRNEYVTSKLQGFIKAWTLTGKVPGENGWATLLTDIFSVWYFIKNLFIFR